MRVFHTHAALSSGRVMLVMSRRREKCNFFLLFVVEKLLTPADFSLFFCWQSFAFYRGGQLKCPLFHRGIAADVC